jgi:GNAT superfamily N-acetyltransferase
MADQLVMVTAEGDILAAKQAVQNLDGLGQSCDARRAIVEAEARRLVLGEAVSGAETEFNASAGQGVERERLARYDIGVAQVVVEHERPDAEGRSRFGGHPEGRKRRDASIDEVIGNRERREPEILGLSGRAHPLVMPRQCKNMEAESKIVHAYPCSHSVEGRSMATLIVPLADRPASVRTVGRWHWQLWGSEDPGGSLELWTARVAAWANNDAIPMIFIAIAGEEPVGSVSLVAHDLPERRDLWHLWPWLSGLYVLPEYRGRGVGRALVARVEAQARSMGVVRLYLYTAQASGLYDQLGWDVIGEDVQADAAVTIMAKRVADSELAGEGYS